jgi:hypothetical protein
MHRRARDREGHDRALFARHQAITVGADKGFDTAGFVAGMRDFNVTPHLAQKQPLVWSLA